MSFAESVFLYTWLTEWHPFFKCIGFTTLKQQFSFSWIDEQRKKKVFKNGLNNIKEDWKCYRDKTHFLVNQSLAAAAVTAADDDDDDNDNKNNAHDNKLE